MEYNKFVVEVNPFYIKHQEEIKKSGIHYFLKNNGVFVEVIPLIKHPNDGGYLMGYNLEIKYRYRKIDETRWVMREIEDYSTYKTSEEAYTEGIIKSFAIVEQKNNSVRHMSV